MGFYTLYCALLVILLISGTQVQAKPTLLVLGDSLSAGYGMEKQFGWVSLLEQKKELEDIQVVNASISGETTSGGLQRLPLLLKQHQPQWLIIELGANDALRGQNLTFTQRNLNSIIQQCLAIHCKPILLGIRLPTNYGPAYDYALQQVYQRLAVQYKLTFDPFFLEGIATEEKYMQQDGLHPNQQAQPLILQRVWQTLSPLFQP